MLKRIIPYILYAIVVAGLILAIILAFHHSQNTASKSKKSTSTGSSQHAAPRSTPSSPKPAATAGSATQQSHPTYAAANTQNGAPAGGSPQTLSNSGPGDVVTLFVLTTAGSAAAYSVYQRKRVAA